MLEYFRIRMVNKNEVNSIEVLFQEVYNKVQGAEYWEWMFDAPGGYIPMGIFFKNKLIAFYSAVMLGDHAVCYSAMVHPKYQGKKYIQIVAQACFDEVKERGGKYVYLFANKNIKNIYTKYLGFIEAFCVREFMINYSKIKVNQFKGYYPLFFNEFVQWRYAQHPHHQEPNNRYIYYYNPDNAQYVAFSTYKTKVQILDYTNLDDAIGIGMFIAFLLKKKRITFWSEKEVEYLSYFISTWKMYKNLGNNIDLGEIIKNDRLRMYQSDVF